MLNIIIIVVRLDALKLDIRIKSNQQQCMWNSMLNSRVIIRILILIVAVCLCMNTLLFAGRKPRPFSMGEDSMKLIILL